MVTEDQQRDEACTDQVESSRIRVEEFGTYCESLHDSNGKGFREQFYVRNSVGVRNCLCAWHVYNYLGLWACMHSASQSRRTAASIELSILFYFILFYFIFLETTKWGGRSLR